METRTKLRTEPCRHLLGIVNGHCSECGSTMVCAQQCYDVDLRRLRKTTSALIGLGFALLDQLTEERVMNLYKCKSFLKVRDIARWLNDNQQIKYVGSIYDGMDIYVLYEEHEGGAC